MNEPVEIVEGPNPGEVFTAESFLNYLRRSQDHWWKDSPEGPHCPWVFRGHWDAGWKLVPSAARPMEQNKLAPIAEELRSVIAAEYDWWCDKSNGFQDQHLLVKAHMKAVREFVLLARELKFKLEKEPLVVKAIGDPPPAQGSTGNTYEYYAARWLYENTSYNYLTEPAVALAQHHGIPTFLLDWTENPIIAGYFATTAPRKKVRDLCVWAFATDTRMQLSVACSANAHGGSEGGIRIVRPLKSENEYLASQSGVLTYLGNPGQQWAVDGSYPSLEDIVSTFRRDYLLELAEKSEQGFDVHDRTGSAAIKRLYADQPVFLRKFILKQSEVRAFSKLLRREGMTQAHMIRRTAKSGIKQLNPDSRTPGNIVGGGSDGDIGVGL